MSLKIYKRLIKNLGIYNMLKQMMTLIERLLNGITSNIWQASNIKLKERYRETKPNLMMLKLLASIGYSYPQI